jgi:PhzF family phenazine biosynthesis protein
MDKWLPEDLMMSITRENNLSETAFAVKNGDTYRLRWFTPGGEIDLCGHATLGTAYVIMNYFEPDLQQLSFDTMSGELTVLRRGELYEMDFPAYELKPVEVTAEMTAALGVKPLEAYMGRDLLCVLETEEQVRELTPDMEKIKQLDGLLQHVTAAGKDFDCVSRSFAPKLNIVEDPVCGSGHCHVVPYWVDKLGKSDILAYQASRRGGTLYCRKEGDRIKMSGKVVAYSAAELFV